MTEPHATNPSQAREPTPPPTASTSVSSRPVTRCAAPGCTLPLTRTGRGRPTRYCSPTCKTAAHREHRRHRNQPLRVETDHGSTSAKNRSGGRVWLVRLRRGHRAVIIATGLTRPAAEHLTHQINQLLHPPPHSAGHPTRNDIHHARTGARHAKNLDTDDTINVNDLTSPTSPKQGISLSNTAEFRRASSVPKGTPSHTAEEHPRSATHPQLLANRARSSSPHPAHSPHCRALVNRVDP